MTISLVINVFFGIVAILVSFISYYYYIKTVIDEAAADAINDAEKLDKSGAEKLAIATDAVYALVPKILRSVLPKSLVHNLVQSAFDKIESYAKQQKEKEDKEIK